MPKPELVASDILSGVIFEAAKVMVAIRSENIILSSSCVDGIVNYESCRRFSFDDADGVELEASEGSSRIASAKLLLRVLIVGTDWLRSIISTY